ncbi:MAG: EAL domain-containing protein [Rhodospirillales bacterium]|nr:EAL domain-containing protein [Rhodospirillales bacterium]
MISLARDCGVAVAAESVESQTQLAFLKAEGCDLAQGFLLGRPVPPADFPLIPAAA